MPLSRRVRNIAESASIRMNQIVADLKARGEDLTVLSLGDTFFAMNWPSFDAMDLDKGSNYSDSRGIAELRAQLATFYQKRYGAQVDPATEILVTAGSKMAIFMVMLSVLEPGDEVAIPEPAWVSYQEQAGIVGAIPRFIPHDVDIERIHERFTAKTKLLILNNPNNPAGRLYDAQEIASVYEQCRERGVYLLVDEAYSDFLYADDFVSLASIVPKKDGAIVVNSLSKSLGIAGWRLGYLIADAAFVKQCLKLNQHLITCAPTILQQYVARYFDELTGATLPQAQLLAEQRSRIGSVMDDLGLVKMAGTGTFYYFISIEDYPGNADDFALDLLINDKISVVPGSSYGESTDRFVRVSLGYEPEDRVIEAFRRIKSLATSGVRRKTDYSG
jgi:aspartate/methionine/tyrosine aminotransferase